MSTIEQRYDAERVIKQLEQLAEIANDTDLCLPEGSIKELLLTISAGLQRRYAPKVPQNEPTGLLRCQHCSYFTRSEAMFAAHASSEHKAQPDELGPVLEKTQRAKA
ncbi:MAG: hypothetical protein ABSG69_14050 [Candidatus Acidiferrum sp.]|jgi:hypothetical protein